MKTGSLQRVLLSGLDFPEGPVFDSLGRSLVRGTAGLEPGKEIGHRGHKVSDRRSTQRACY